MAAFKSEVKQISYSRMMRDLYIASSIAGLHLSALFESCTTYISGS